MPGDDYYSSKGGEIFQVKVRRRDYCRARLMSVMFKKLKNLEADERAVLSPNIKRDPLWRGEETMLDVLVFERVE